MGFGEVWLAEKRTKFVTTRVAVKLPLDEQVDHEAIEQEATLWEKASGHPNVLPIIDADEYDGQIVIVSEYAPDGSLEQLLQSGEEISIEKAVNMTVQILKGLEFLHSRDIIHRDLKPANILLQGDTLRLADFGISRALQATVASQTQNISGTFSYMSPEALDGKRSVQTDVWSAGVNLYRFLTNNLPFPQKEPSALFPAIIMRDYDKLPESIPQSLKTIIAKSLAKLPENRYQSATEMRDDLQKVLRGDSVSEAVQTKLGKLPSGSPIPPTEKVIAISAQNFQSETETVVHPISITNEEGKHKGFDLRKYGVIAVILVSVFGLGLYFFTSLTKQSRLDKAKISKTLQPTPVSNLESDGKQIDSTVDLESPTPIPTPDKSQLQKLINGFVAKGSTNLNKEYIRDTPRGERIDDWRYRLDRKKVAYGDLDGDGDQDAVATFSFCESSSCHVTTHSSYLVFFLKDNGVFALTSSVDLRSLFAEIQRVKSAKIYIKTTNLKADDPQCCPSRIRNVVYGIVATKLSKLRG